MQVEAGHFLGHFLLVVGDVDGHQVALHQVGDLRVRLAHRRDQLPGGYQPAQVLLVVDDVDVVDRLQLLRLAADLFQRLAYGEPLAEPGIVRGHHGAGRAFGVGLQAKDVAAFDGRNERQQLFDDLAVDALEHVDAIIGLEIGDQFADLRAIGRFDDFDLLVAVEVAEDLGPRLVIGVAQHVPGFVGGESFHELGRAGRVQGDAEFAQLGLVVFGQHFAKFGQVERVGHKPMPGRVEA